MSEKKNKSSMLTGRIGTFKGKKYNEKPTDYIKKRKGSGASGALVRLKDITGRPGMVNPSYGTDFDDR